MTRIFRYGVLGVLCLLLAVETSQAGGLYLYEVGSPDVGLAAAGYAARAQDASTAFTNPAGMTRIERPSLMLGAQPMYIHLDFNPDSGTSPVAGTLPLRGGPADDGDSNGWMPAGGLFYVHPVNDKLTARPGGDGILRLGPRLPGRLGRSLLCSGSNPAGRRSPAGDCLADQ